MQCKSHVHRRRRSGASAPLREPARLSQCALGSTLPDCTVGGQDDQTWVSGEMRCINMAIGMNGNAACADAMMRSWRGSNGAYYNDQEQCVFANNQQPCTSVTALQVCQRS